MSTDTSIEQSLDILKEKITELKTFSEENNIDLSLEIKTLEDKSKRLADELYANLNAWQKVQLSRHKDRPTTLDYIQHLFDDFMELHGDRLFADDPAIVGGIGSFEGIPVTVIGNQKGKNTKDNLHRRFGMAQPEGYRKALRLMQQANKFNRPIITFINTAGAFPGREAEERGQSEAIARNLREMASFNVPIICFVIGEGGSGGALALGIGNKVFMLENTFYSVISPEGAAALLWKDSSKAQTAANTLKVTADDLKRLDVIDEIVKEPKGGSHKNIKEQADSLRIVIREALNELTSFTPEELKTQRYQRFRNIGKYLDI